MKYRDFIFYVENSIFHVKYQELIFIWKRHKILYFLYEVLHPHFHM